MPGRFIPDRLLPRGLYGRAALILVFPIVIIQLVVSMAFIQRHYEGVTRQMTRGVAIDLEFVLSEFATGDTAATALARAERVAAPLEIALSWPAGDAAPKTDAHDLFDVAGQAIIGTFHAEVPAIRAVDVTAEDRQVRLRIATAHGDLLAEVARHRMVATNPHQLLVIMIFASALMTLIAYMFLRNQLRPIARLARAAEAFGRGEKLRYRPRGALEVRAAGHAFIEMRDRIERQIEQRMLMLSGVSHDLRTPLTRMRLALAFMPEDAETRALAADVAQMERMVDDFLAFVRGTAAEGEEETDLGALVSGAVADARRAGGDIDRLPDEGQPRPVRLHPQAVRRALDNLIGNALRHGSRAEVGLVWGAASVILRVEDDGPGIPEAARAEAVRPFTRLGGARDPNRGGGVGLGLAIATDIAQGHGGALRLSDSTRLGGLKAELELAR